MRMAGWVPFGHRELQRKLSSPQRKPQRKILSAAEAKRRQERYMCISLSLLFDSHGACGPLISCPTLTCYLVVTKENSLVVVVGALYCIGKNETFTDTYFFFTNACAGVVARQYLSFRNPLCLISVSHRCLWVDYVINRPGVKWWQS